MFASPSSAGILTDLPRETPSGETRVALRPRFATRLTRHGARVVPHSAQMIAAGRAVGQGAG